LKGLDGQADYHIIKNSLKAAAAGKGAAGKLGGRGGFEAKISEKNIDNFGAASYTYKVKNLGSFGLGIRGATLA